MLFAHSFDPDARAARALPPTLLGFAAGILAIAFYIDKIALTMVRIMLYLTRIASQTADSRNRWRLGDPSLFFTYK